MTDRPGVSVSQASEPLASAIVAMSADDARRLTISLLAPIVTSANGTDEARDVARALLSGESAATWTRLRRVQQAANLRFGTMCSAPSDQPARPRRKAEEALLDALFEGGPGSEVQIMGDRDDALRGAVEDAALAAIVPGLPEDLRWQLARDYLRSTVYLEPWPRWVPDGALHILDSVRRLSSSIAHIDDLPWTGDDFPGGSTRATARAIAADRLAQAGRVEVVDRLMYGCAAESAARRPESGPDLVLALAASDAILGTVSPFAADEHWAMAVLADPLRAIHHRVTRD